ncbi:DUF5988 family protein [Micromonospora eburnea]|uniref:Uncharacterized protein n=1 Tax=Micromonospora eburnea TaxID=227316 RepID=A0A1C6UZ23_9ACTN|nr:DUF5988 family protein [Micromonospora eburnea]SCL59271.1 hypothetical protein GA0070604_4018 [Micromonospora eburnea]
MDNSVDSAAGALDVVLEGGPDTLPQEQRRRRVDPLTDTVKVCHYGGHEHFRKVDGETTADGSSLFRWIGRTRIAE